MTMMTRDEFMSEAWSQYLAAIGDQGRKMVGLEEGEDVYVLMGPIPTDRLPCLFPVTISQMRTMCEQKEQKEIPMWRIIPLPLEDECGFYIGSYLAGVETYPPFHVTSLESLAREVYKW